MKSISMKEKYKLVELPKMISSLQDIDNAIQYVSALDDFSDNMLFQLQKRLTDKNLEEILEDKFYSTYDNIIQKRKNDYIKEKIVSDKKIIDVQTFIQKTNISKKDMDSVVLYLKMNKEYSEYNSHLILKAISRRIKNKREEIHNQSLDLSSIGVNSYYAINHSTFEGWNFHLLFCGL